MTRAVLGLLGAHHSRYALWDAAEKICYHQTEIKSPPPANAVQLLPISARSSKLDTIGYAVSLPIVGRRLEKARRDVSEL
jgi:hypothetical protein